MASVTPHRDETFGEAMERLRDEIQRLGAPGLLAEWDQARTDADHRRDDALREHFNG